MNPNEVPLVAIDAAERAYRTERWANSRVRLIYAIAAALGAMPTQTELQTRLDALKAEKDELQALCDKLAGLLSRTAVALRGPEPPLTRWSWHDLPERAQAAIAAIDVMQRAAFFAARDEGESNG